MNIRYASILNALLLSCGLSLLACAPVKPPEPPPKDEFTGFGALRGEPREKKKDPGDAKGEAKGDPPEEQGGNGGGEAMPLDKDQIQDAISSAKPRVAKCWNKHKTPGLYIMEFTVVPNGTCAVAPIRTPTRKEDPQLWEGVALGVDGGQSVKSPMNRCIATALNQVRFPKFQGKPFHFNYPFFLK